VTCPNRPGRLAALGGSLADRYQAWLSFPAGSRCARPAGRRRPTRSVRRRPGI